MSTPLVTTSIFPPSMPRRISVCRKACVTDTTRAARR
jgi:hypothetical protein